MTVCIDRDGVLTLRRSRGRVGWAYGAEAFLRQRLQGDLQRHDDFPGDGVLQRKGVTEFLVVSFCPEVLPGDGIEQLHSNPHVCGCRVHAALEHISRSECLTGLLTPP